MITPARPKKAIERRARTYFFLPEKAYVRNIRMTGDITCEKQLVKHVDLVRAYIVMIVSTVKNREKRLYGKYKLAYRRHGTDIEDVIV